MRWGGGAAVALVIQHAAWQKWRVLGRSVLHGGQSRGTGGTHHKQNPEDDAHRALRHCSPLACVQHTLQHNGPRRDVADW